MPLHLGGSTAYLSPFVREVFAGIIEVTVVKGENLPKADVIGLSDPYCVLSTGGGSSYRTKTKRLTLNPKWSEDEVGGCAQAECSRPSGA